MLLDMTKKCHTCADCKKHNSCEDCERFVCECKHLNISEEED